jgi:hypothetical protein
MHHDLIRPALSSCNDSGANKAREAWVKNATVACA